MVYTANTVFLELNSVFCKSLSLTLNTGTIASTTVKKSSGFQVEVTNYKVMEMSIRFAHCTSRNQHNDTMSKSFQYAF